MIDKFVKVSLKENSLGSVKYYQRTGSSLSIQYPCNDPYKCTPYIIELKKGTYQFECWGSLGSFNKQGKPGLGAYTSGTIFLPKETKFFIYIGTIGTFNAVKEVETQLFGTNSGGATDVRIDSEEKWWEMSSLISRIMVAAGGGGAEWGGLGGNGARENYR